MTPVAVTGSPEVRHSRNPDQSLAESQTQSESAERRESEHRDDERSEAERLEAQRVEERRAQGPALHPVILMGGSGTRLWPLSRNAVPKQLLALTSQRSMLQETLLRLNGIEHLARPVIVCNQEHRFMVAEQLRQINIEPEDIILEPVGRNTAAAVAVAALRLQQSSPDSLMLVLPADHVIANVEAFHTAVAQARRCAQQGCMSTFGVVPGKPETGYGYIQHGEPLRRPPEAGGGGYAAGVCVVKRFVEKPDAPTAQHYVESGEYSWNSGMFLFTAACFIEELEKCAPDVAEVCRAVVENSQRDLDFFRLNKELFASCPSISVDNAVMEKTRRGIMVPVDIGWNDVGSWSALWEYHDKDTGGNVTRGEVLLHDVSNSYVSAERRLVAAVGVDNLVIVETADAILVADKDRAQDVKKIVERLQKEGRTEHEIHRKAYRPWGSYECMDNGQRFQVKRLTVNPQAVLSLQMHHHRSEHWVVVSGTAEVTINGEARLVTENQSVYIPLGAWHRVRNPGHIPLHMIEVQSGPYLGEDDIVRTEDTYGRVDEGSSSK
jgi:mannose-1-phosphate guanylyltransferase/mannose-1-phosphate guanylyltransferase/mannose-6-phosphate isomerase